MHEFLEYRVRDVMSHNPVTCTPDTPLEGIEHLLETHDFNALPVVDATGHLLGVVTKLDFLRAFAFTTGTMIPPYEHILREPAARVMSTAPLTVTADTPLTRVLQMMVETRYRSLPVVEGRRLTGVVAREDVLRALRAAATGERPGSRSIDQLRGC